MSKILVDKAPMKETDCGYYRDGMCANNHLCPVKQEAERLRNTDFNLAFRLGSCPYFKSATSTSEAYEDTHFS